MGADDRNGRVTEEKDRREECRKHVSLMTLDSSVIRTTTRTI